MPISKIDNIIKIEVDFEGSSNIYLNPNFLSIYSDMRMIRLYCIVYSAMKFIVIKIYKNTYEYIYELNYLIN